MIRKSGDLLEICAYARSLSAQSNSKKTITVFSQDEKAVFLSGGLKKHFTELPLTEGAVRSSADLRRESY